MLLIFEMSSLFNSYVVLEINKEHLIRLYFFGDYYKNAKYYATVIIFHFYKLDNSYLKQF